MQTQLGKFLSRQKYLISGFPKVGAYMTEKYFEKHGLEVPLVKECHMNPREIWRKLEFVADDVEEPKT